MKVLTTDFLVSFQVVKDRVAFARALAPNPQLLLLDEPFAAIDAKVRQELRSWLKEMIEKLGVTSIFVTHDQDEAIEVADEIIITNKGRVEQKGSPVEIYQNPQTAFAASFFGQTSLIENYTSFSTFDEIEKAHPDVFNILLQVLDDGHITDSTGRVVDFKNTVIIMTSNAGAQNIVQTKTLGFASVTDEKERHENMKTKVMDEVKRLFKPEFINRIDEIIVFHALNKEQIGSIVDIMIAKVNKRIMEQMKISIELNDEAKKYIVDKGYDEKYGARPLRRTIQNDIEDALAEKILEGTVKQGNSVLVSVKDGKLHFSLKRGINK